MTVPATGVAVLAAEELETSDFLQWMIRFFHRVKCAVTCVFCVLCSVFTVRSPVRLIFESYCSLQKSQMVKTMPSRMRPFWS